MDNIMNQLWGIVDSVLGIVMLVLKAGLVTLKGFGMAVNDGVMTIAGENVLLAGGLYAALAGLGAFGLYRSGLLRKGLEAGAKVPVIGPVAAAVLRLGRKGLGKVRDMNTMVTDKIGGMFN